MITSKRYYKDISSGATASIEVHKDGTATLKVYCAGITTKSEHKNAKSAYQAWYRQIS